MGPNISRFFKTHTNILKIYNMLPNTLKYFYFVPIWLIFLNGLNFTFFYLKILF